MTLPSSRQLSVLLLLVLVMIMVTLPLMAESKTALVIGNSSYSTLPVLKNPVSEAIEMKTVLEEAGFKVIYLTNASKSQMQDAVLQFKQELDQKGGIGLFHYGGHGMQLNGKNYLIPVDANIQEEWQIDSMALDADYVLSAMESSRSEANIIILDACRDNPITSGRRSGTRGFAKMNAPVNSIIVYSAGEGETANDGLFTPTLIRYIRQGGMKFTDMVMQVRREVYEASGKKQRPAEYSMLMFDLWITPVNGTLKMIQPQSDNGNLTITVISPGELWIDGIKNRFIYPGDIVTIDGVDIGVHNVEIRYGRFKESKTVSVIKNETAVLAFDHLPIPIAPNPQYFALIKSGSFTMGSPVSEPDRESDESPQRRVSIHSFWMGRYEITFSEYDAFCSATDREKPDDEGWGRGDRPVINISWIDALEYCNWRSYVDGLTPVYTIDRLRNIFTCDWSANGYRLPTEAEWEFACRSGTVTPFETGLQITTDQANFDGKCPYRASPVGVFREKTLPVGSFKPNQWGLYDLHGNVGEWCWDYWGTYTGTSVTDPYGAKNGQYRVSRGGSWYSKGKEIRSASRYKSAPGNTFDYIGFRLVRPHVE